ncbi:hypothetical protein [Vibrio campbellii]|uniref:hypothetical protein n=1 Tax=Vibrio campbellii TaxID=680 RepID=UPI00210A0EBE|nr:hypothetical protein [Vibrio campbellii]UTZ44527.1 hypothetical protein HB764_25030 [Vibrio campbellii]
MAEPTVVIDCPSCEKDFRESVLKHIGDKFQCPHCFHPMKAESDYGEDGEIIWFAVTDKSMQCKPKWSDHDFAAICLTGNGDWFGLYEAVKPCYSDEWKGQEVTIAHGQGEFIKHGNITNLINIEQYYEVRPTK